MQSKNYKSSTGNTLDLNFGTYNQHCKPNVETLYIHAKSNHPANILKQPPRTKVKFPADLVTLLKKSLMENFIFCARLCNLSSNPETFHKASKHQQNILTLSRRRSLSYRNQCIDLLCKSLDWFLYDNGLRLERVKSIRGITTNFNTNYQIMKMKTKVKHYMVQPDFFKELLQQHR